MVMIDQLNIDPSLKTKLKSMLEAFETSKNANNSINYLVEEELEAEAPKIDAGETATENIKRKLYDFFNNFFYTEYEEELA